MDLFILVLELIGTVAFASSGALAAMEKRMDLFGVNMLGIVTAVGGGIMRDVILGLTPPAAFSQPVYVLTAAVTSTLLFGVVYLRPSALDKELRKGLYDRLMFWCDTLGLGIFTVMGYGPPTACWRRKMHFSSSSQAFSPAWAGAPSGMYFQAGRRISSASTSMRWPP